MAAKRTRKKASALETATIDSSTIETDIHTGTPAEKGAPLAPEPTAEDREVEGESASAVIEANEDMPMRPAPQRNKPRLQHGHNTDQDAEGCHCYDSSFPRGKLPPPPILQARELEEDQKPKPKTGKDGIDRAMEILDEYYEGTPLRDPNVDHGGED